MSLACESQGNQSVTIVKTLKTRVKVAIGDNIQTEGEVFAT